MCGIAGIWNLNGSKLTELKLKRFTEALAHRGPDGAGYYISVEGNLGLGHRRLSILDLSDAGKQPMSFANERYWITYNGEIYNFIELQKELKAHGYSFNTNTDTEVLLSAFHMWGKNCLHKFNGMWAFGIWDKEERSLFLARDRFGVKPLYYYSSPELFAFASETIAFKSLEGFKRTINKELIQRTILDYQKVEASGYTMFEDIIQLNAGCSLKINSKGKIDQERWWNILEQMKPSDKSYEDQTEVFKELFESSCKLRLRSDVSLASALSGGVDSSAVYCMLKHLMQKNDPKERIPNNWQKAFVATFPGTPLDERKYAEEVIAFTKGEVNYIEPDYSNLASDIISSTLKFDGISGTPIIAASDIYKAMRKSGIFVSMDGHGADETMFGYRASVAEAYFDARLNHNEKYAEDILNTYLNMFETSEINEVKKRIAKREQNVTEFEANAHKNMGLIKLRSKLRALTDRHKISYFDKLITTDWFNYRVLEKPRKLNFNEIKLNGFSRSEKRLLNDFHIDHIPYNLRDFDRASMQHGVEIRMPFMDYRLVTFLFSQKTEFKLGNGYTKRILRDSMKGIMPENIRTRRLKMGLTAPVASWFNNHLSEFVKDQVSSEKFMNSPYWNGKIIKQYALDLTNNKAWNENSAGKFWNVLNAHIIANGD